MRCLSVNVSTFKKEVFWTDWQNTLCKIPRTFFDISDMKIEKYKFAQHLVDNRHSIGSIKDITELLHITRRENTMNALE
jgi:hypothetical protein